MHLAKLIPLITAVCEGWHWIRPLVIKAAEAVS